MNVRTQLIFFNSDLAQYNYLISNAEIRDKVADFLLQYVSAEGFYKKLLKADKEKSGKKLTAQDKKELKVSVPVMKKVLTSFGVQYDENLLERLFSNEDKNYMECSAKKLRDRLVHNVNQNVVRTIIERYDSIRKDIDEFFEMFSNKKEHRV